VLSTAFPLEKRQRRVRKKLLWLEIPHAIQVKTKAQHGAKGFASMRVALILNLLTRTAGRLLVSSHHTQGGVC